MRRACLCGACRSSPATRNSPQRPTAGASQTTATVGSAVYEAGQVWKSRLLDYLVSQPRSCYAGCDVSTLDVRDGEVVSSDPTRPTTAVGELIAAGGVEVLDRLAFTTTSDGAPAAGPVSQSFGAHFCEVEVDEEIGRATVTRWVGVMDCGTVINPKLARSQVIGGITFGLGMALMEQVPYDPGTGRPLGEYYLPTHADVPTFDITFIEGADYHLDAFGARGIGEIGICGVPAAIANAIFHATGRRLRDLPITIEHLLVPFSVASHKDVHP